MSDDDPMPTPVSFPVPSDRLPVRRRAVFSYDVRGLHSHHADADGVRVADSHRRRRGADDSLQLIDDLTNRPMDPLFSDSRLAVRHRSAVEIWCTRIIVLLTCIAVGFGGSLFVRQLHTDPRKGVRQSLAADLQNQRRTLDDLAKEVDTLSSTVQQRSEALAPSSSDTTSTRDAMMNGTVAVQGPGITVTVANPLSVSADGSLPRESSSGKIRVVTDADLQQMVSMLWSLGAEAIAINDQRIGVQTSVRTAGQSILVGTQAVQSPYIINAIGDASALEAAMRDTRDNALLSALGDAGITIQVSTSSTITMQAAVSNDAGHVRRSE